MRFKYRGISNQISRVTVDVEPRLQPENQRATRFQARKDCGQAPQRFTKSTCCGIRYTI